MPKRPIPNKRWRRELLAALLWLLAAPAAAGLFDRSSGGSDFLPANEAFELDVLAVGPGQIEARWLVAPGYYLYRHRLDARLLEPADTPLKWRAPAGEAYHDEHFGEVEIYRDQLLLPLALDAAGPVRLELEYQGCADAGLCYPPQRRIVTVEMPEGP